MTTIGMICEGASELKILTYIINRYLGDDVAVNRIQPPTRMSHGIEKQDNEGGWLQVLNHCNDSVICNNMVSNDYIIIQIDTDACFEKNYDVDIYDDNHKKVSDGELYERVCTRLKQNISSKVWEAYSNKILFAICFNETECWLLPLYYENDAQKRCATTNCIYILNQQLQKDGIGIPEKNKNSSEALSVYQKILKRMKRKDIPAIAQCNFGFQKFVEQLETIQQENSNEDILT